MPVQLDLFGSPLRPPKKIREDEAPAPAAPVTQEAEKPASVPESYVAVIHPKDNKQGWHTITTSNQPEEAPALEEENDATGVNEEAAVGQEAFVEETPEEDTPATEEPLVEEEVETASVADAVAGDGAVDEVEPLADELETEELETGALAPDELETDDAGPDDEETEGIESFSEAAIDEPLENEEAPEEEPAVEEFTDDSTNEFIDEAPDTFIDEEPDAEEEQEEVLEEEPESFLAEEREEPVGQEPATEEPEVFTEEEIVAAEEQALGEPSDEAVAEQEPEATDLPAEEIETEGTESFSEPELVEADEPEAVLEEPENEEDEIVDDAQAQTYPDGMVENELAPEEENAPTETSVIAATTADEPVGKRGRKPIQDYDDDAGNLNVPPDEDLFKRQYYSMRETAAMFGVNQSLLRFWENEFKILQPKKNKKGDRYFRPVDVKNLVLIHHLLRVRKFTMEGAKEYLQSNKKAGDAFELGKRLEKLKSFLLELKASL